MCISLEGLLIDIIILVAAVAIITYVIPRLIALVALPGADIIVYIFRIILWVIVAIFIVKLAFALFGCMGLHGW